MLYLFSIFLFLEIIAVVNIFAVAPSIGLYWWQIIIWTLVCFISVLIIDGVLATIARWALPKKWFSVEKTWFMAGNKERKFLEKIRIKKWKDSILELGAFTKFRKNKILDPTNNEYISQYIEEANYGIMCHLTGIIFGFFATFCCPISLWLSVGLVISIINAFYNWLSFSILRYNLPKLHTLYKYNKRREERKVA